MIQLYFLSILCNGLAGYVLFSENKNSAEKLPFSLNNSTFILVLGILSAVIGVLKILSPVRGGFFFGDLLPGSAGIIAGLALIFGIYRQNEVNVKPGQLDKIGYNLLTFRKPIALGLIASALLHFIFGEVIFL
ncbi:MAG: hypothetical protein FWC21_00515 [Treponema sp.]|nr:hypothetical protein [Treponema sp.]